MDSKIFILGLAIGMIGGGLIVANSKKARQMLKNSQEQIRRKADELAHGCDCGCDCDCNKNQNQSTDENVSHN